MIYIHEHLPDGYTPFQESIIPENRPSLNLSDVEREWVTNCTMAHSTTTFVYSPGFFAEWVRIVNIKTGKPVLIICNAKNQKLIEQAQIEIGEDAPIVMFEQSVDQFSFDFQMLGGVAIWREGCEHMHKALPAVLSLLAHSPLEPFYFVKTIN